MTETEQHERNLEEGHKRPLSEEIVNALAAAEDVDSYELTTRLYDSLDPDALDELYETASERDGHLRLAFTIGNHEVVIKTGRRISVRKLEEDLPQ